MQSVPINTNVVGSNLALVRCTPKYKRANSEIPVYKPIHSQSTRERTVKYLYTSLFIVKYFLLFQNMHGSPFLVKLLYFYSRTCMDTCLFRNTKIGPRRFGLDRFHCTRMMYSDQTKTALMGLVLCDIHMCE
jgi:hypothetical protein